MTNEKKPSSIIIEVKVPGGSWAWEMKRRRFQTAEEAVVVAKEIGESAAARGYKLAVRVSDVTFSAGVL